MVVVLPSEARDALPYDSECAFKVTFQDKNILALNFLVNMVES